MPGSIVSLTPSVADVRFLRAAAFVPRVIALTLVVVLPIAYAADSDWSEVAWLAVAALVLWICAALLERGVTAIALLIAVAIAGIAVVGVVETLRSRDAAELWSGLGTLAALGALAWMFVHAARASRRLAQSGRKPRARSSTARKLAGLPRDARLMQSLGPFVAASGIWTVGAAAALLVAAVVPAGRGLFGGLAFFAFALAAGRKFDSARRLLALRLDEVRARDRRRPLVLLRSFADDNLPLERRFSIFGNLLQRPFTLEEFTVDRLWPVGPVMAIGRPGETLSPAGAAREYVADAEWRDHFLAGLDECALAVGVLGSSDGVMWEFLQVGARGAADRFILMFPPHAAPILAQRWTMFCGVFPAAGNGVLPAGNGLPLAAMFPQRRPPVFYCCKYQNETAYAMALDDILQSRIPYPGS